VVADLPRIRQHGPPGPDRVQMSEADILPAEEADLGGDADPVSIGEKWLGSFHQCQRVSQVRTTLARMAAGQRCRGKEPWTLTHCVGQAQEKNQTEGFRPCTAPRLIPRCIASNQGLRPVLWASTRIRSRRCGSGGAGSCITTRVAGSSVWLCRPCDIVLHDLIARWLGVPHWRMGRVWS
jgi:hypothetical protein